MKLVTDLWTPWGNRSQAGEWRVCTMSHHLTGCVWQEIWAQHISVQYANDIFYHFKGILGSPVEPDNILFNTHQTKRPWYKSKLFSIQKPASSFTYFISCSSLSVIFKIEGHFPRGFTCVSVLHSLLTESSIMTPLGAECAIWTDK